MRPSTTAIAFWNCRQSTASKPSTNCWGDRSGHPSYDSFMRLSFPFLPSASLWLLPLPRFQTASRRLPSKPTTPAPRNACRRRSACIARGHNCGRPGPKAGGIWATCSTTRTVSPKPARRLSTFLPTPATVARPTPFLACANTKPATTTAPWSGFAPGRERGGVDRLSFAMLRNFTSLYCLHGRAGLLNPFI